MDEFNWKQEQLYIVLELKFIEQEKQPKALQTNFQSRIITKEPQMNMLEIELKLLEKLLLEKLSEKAEKKRGIIQKKVRRRL